MNTLMITPATNAENKAEQKASLNIQVEVSQDDLSTKQLCKGILLLD